jgi:sodium pump decarboxylase gamma subunit
MLYTGTQEGFMELLWNAAIIMALGMLVVFFVLFLVIQGVQIAARIIHHFEGEPQAEVAALAAAQPAPAVLAAVIAAAIHRSRTK